MVEIDTLFHCKQYGPQSLFNDRAQWATSFPPVLLGTPQQIVINIDRSFHGPVPSKT